MLTHWAILYSIELISKAAVTGSNSVFAVTRVLNFGESRVVE